MRRKTRIRLVRWLKWGWILAHIVTVLMLFAGSSRTCDPDCILISNPWDTVLTVALLLGFPSSFLCMVGSTLWLNWNNANFDFMPLWVAAVVGGYIQWFVVLPRLLKVTKPITLGISRIRHRPIAHDDASLEKSLVQEKITRKMLKKPAKQSEQIPQFDTKGRTPLERALAATKLRS
jgi:hypothetical protein